MPTLDHNVGFLTLALAWPLGLVKLTPYCLSLTCLRALDLASVQRHIKPGRQLKATARVTHIAHTIILIGLMLDLVDVGF